MSGGPRRAARRVDPSVTLLLLSIQHALIHGQAALYPLVYLAIVDEWSIGPGEVAFLAAIGSIATGSIQLAFGALSRRFSRLSMLTAGGVILGIGTGLQAIAPSFGPFALANVFSRLGGAPQHPVGNALLTEQYPSRRWGFAISSHIAGGNVGTVIVGVAAAAMVAQLGWRTSVVLLGVPAIVTAAALYWFVRESGVGARGHAALGTVRQAYRAVLADRDLRWLFLSSMLGGGARGLGVLNVFVPLYLGTVLGLPIETIGLMYAVLLIASVPGPIVAGRLSDRYGPRRLIVLIYVAGAASLAWFILAGRDIPLVWIGIAALSVFSFVESPQLQALLADISPPAIRDEAYAMYFALAFGVGSMWGLLYGALVTLDPEQGLTTIFWVMAGANILAALAALPIRARRR